MFYALLPPRSYGTTVSLTWWDGYGGGLNLVITADDRHWVMGGVACHR